MKAHLALGAIKEEGLIKTLEWLELVQDISGWNNRKARDIRNNIIALYNANDYSTPNHYIEELETKIKRSLIFTAFFPDDSEDEEKLLTDQICDF